MVTGWILLVAETNPTQGQGRWAMRRWGRWRPAQKLAATPGVPINYKSFAPLFFF